MGKNTEIARAVRRGDWHKVIELETATLEKEEHKQFSYAMIGMAYDNLKEYENAKENYAKALEHDQCCGQALEGLSRIYFNEKNYNLAYHYVLKSLHSVKETNYAIPKYLKIIMAIIIKVLRPRRPFKEILEETNDMDQSRNKWIKWATGFKNWYEENIENENKPKLH